MRKGIFKFVGLLSDRCYDNCFYLPDYLILPTQQDVASYCVKATLLDIARVKGHFKMAPSLQALSQAAMMVYCHCDVYHQWPHGSRPWLLTELTCCARWYTKALTCVASLAQHTTPSRQVIICPLYSPVTRVSATRSPARGTELVCNRASS